LEQIINEKVILSSLPKVTLSEMLTKDQYLRLTKEGGVTNFSEEHLVRLFTMRSYGMTVKEISEKLGFPLYVIDKVISSMEYRAVADTITQDITTVAKDSLALAVTKATSTLVGLLDSEDDRIKLKASTEILNRTGLDSVKRVQVQGKTEHIHSLPDEQLQYILKSAQIANALALKTVDITADVVEYEESDEE